MLSAEEFKSLAHLARLDGNDPSLQGLRGDLNRIVDFVEKIKELDTGGADQVPAAHETRNVTRADEPGQGLDPRTLAELAPKWDAGHFVVPRVIDAE